MKQASGILNIVLIIAVLILFFLHFDSNKSYETRIAAIENSSTGKDSTAAVIDMNDLPAYAGAVVYINQDSLNENCKKIKKKAEQAQKKVTKLQNDYNTKKATAEQKLLELDQKSQTANQFEMAKLQGEFQRIQLEFQQYEQKIQKQLLDIEGKNYTILKTYVVDAIERVNTNGHFDYVMIYNEQADFILPFNDSLDITNLIIQEIDGK